MKSKESILEENFLVKGFVFRNGTPLETANKLIYLINSRQRVILDYGCIETKKSWNEKYDVCGYVGYTSGAYGFKYPIIVHNARSLSGGLIITDKILSIRLSKGKKLLFEHK